MANCPKCDYKLRLIDWRPECPKCGINVLYYNFEEDFYRDAKIAELDIAMLRVRWMRAKAAYVGNKLSITKLALCFLPLLCLLLPQGSVGLRLPLFSKTSDLNLLGLIHFFTDGTDTFFNSLAESELFGNYASGIRLMFLSLGVLVLLALTVIVFQLLSFISYKKMSLLIIVFSSLGLVIQGFLLTRTALAARNFESEIFVFKALPWGVVCSLAFLLVTVLNFLSYRRGPTVNYVEGDLYRLEVYKKLKRKELTLENLPQPIYDSKNEAQKSDDGNKAGGGEGVG